MWKHVAQQEQAGSLTVPETPHAELAQGQRRSLRSPLCVSAVPADPPQDTLAVTNRGPMSAMDINTLGKRLAEQVSLLWQPLFASKILAICKIQRLLQV